MPNEINGSTSDSCVVLGGSGFLGQHLCERLVNEGHRVISISRNGPPSNNYEAWRSSVRWVSAPMGSTIAAESLKGVRFVFHLSSTTVPSTSNANIVSGLEANVAATVHMLEAAVAYNVERIIFVSSGGTVYGIPRQDRIEETHPTDPICSYGIEKLAIEKYLLLFRSVAGLDSVVLRVSNLYGEAQNPKGKVGAVAHFTDRALRDRPIEIWGDGSIVRDYVHVDDVVDALMISMKYRGPQGVFNIATGRGVSLNQLIGMIRMRLEHRVSIEYKASRTFDVPRNILDVSKASEQLNWLPRIGLETGLDRLIGKFSAV